MWIDKNDFIKIYTLRKFPVCAFEELTEVIQANPGKIDYDW
jgi:hypothetical protein